MTSRLRELIRSIRECKTAAEERAIVAKESADLRASFKEGDVEYRHRNVAKLMYLHMLGYPTHFGQMECLKLIAGNGFPEKRIGYLGLMALLDERQEVLMLVTNSLKRDLNGKNQYVIGLALCALGNICSSEMARDLAPDVKKLMRSSTIYIKKKAALCAVRLAQKVPELVHDFKDEALALLDERSHGVLLGAVTLALELCNLTPEAIAWFATRASNLVKMLKHLTTSGGSSFSASDHHVHGIPDPFLQVKILHLLRILGKGNTEVSDLMSDVLAQVATNTTSGKNAGHAILYECAQTIIETESVGGLRVLAVNILGKFLSNRDNNMRYVALHTLTKVVAIDAKAVQRHKSVIVECVRDADVSIRKRALELACALVNPTNVDAFMQELLDFIADSDANFKTDLVQRVCTLVERFHPSPKWYVDVMADVLEKAGSHVNDRAARSFVVMISTTPEIQGYAVRKLYRVLFENMEKACSVLQMVCLWCVGEFGDQLVNGDQMVEGELPLKVTDDEVVALVEQVLRHSAEVSVMEYGLTGAIKLSERYPAQAEKVKALIGKYKTSSFVELQQRACEYGRLFMHEKIRPQLLEHMPPMLTDDGEDEQSTPTSAGNGTTRPPQPAEAAGTTNDTGLGVDLLGGVDDIMAGPSSSGADALADLLGGADLSSPVPAPQAVSAKPNDLMDMLGGGAAPQAPQAAAGDPLADLMGTGPATASTGFEQPAMQPAFPSLSVYQNHGVTIEFNFEKNPNSPAVTIIRGTYKNTSPMPVTNFLVQAAVPKFIQLHLEPASGNQLPPLGAGQVQQRITLTNSMHGQKPLMIRLKLDFAVNNQPISDMVEVKNFPPGL
eukprot:CAMPEP_0198243782 /NCGR_PEP_ID=MMETSP1446-20131203/30684_1 /TAXON_ID=1461542 ORGANISM="Unidentified sp, Strain CCMP2111" /NCGR_SAMPLE_ID=MMETSP1446 /ASSEMBLY_ACC=CAM_ASM_001112 /LENGTH=840 /DNA_ID=CAMNT_0043927703 /DNA_START=54 /DNA_END=2576 /DNA_ORIENTATION=-